MTDTRKSPKRTIAFYSRVSVWMALLFISAGLAMQSVQVNFFTQNDVDQAFTNAVASQMAHTLSTRLQDTQRLQKAASALPQTLYALRHYDSDWPITLRQLLPGVLSIQLLDKTQIDNLHISYGYAVEDLARRTLTGDDLQLEALQRNNSLQFYRATPIKDGNKIEGVLLAEYGDTWLMQYREAISSNPGSVRITQFMKGEKTRGIEILNLKSKSGREGVPITIPITETWFLTYVPTDERPVLDIAPFISIWIAVLIATISTLVLFLSLQKRNIDKNKLKLLNYVRTLRTKGKDERPEFTLALFDDLADDILHIIRTGRVHNSKDDIGVIREKPDLVIEPVRKSTTAVTERAPIAYADHFNADFEVEELSSIEEEVPCPINPSMFRAYDIRGIVGTDLTDEVCYWLGRAIGAEVLAHEQKALSLAWDGRHSSPNFAQELERGVLDAGCSVINLGAEPTGVLYFATHVLNSSSGVMITGSHNSAEYNGLKIVIDQQPLTQSELNNLCRRIQTNDLPKLDTRGKVIARNLEAEYLERITSVVKLKRPLKVVIDAGNGIAGPLAQQLMQKLGAETISLFCDVDGNFPNHHPDPGVVANLKTLRETVVREKADVGLAFDGDGDRVALIDSRGKIIWADRLLMLLAKDILARNPGETVLFDVKSSRHLTNLITQFGGQARMAPTGHSLMKRQMKNLKAILGGEFSGHIYIKDRWYGFDDGLYVAARLLDILSQRNEPSTMVFSKFPEEISTPEITIDTDDQRKFTVIKSLMTDSALRDGATIADIDGLRLEFADGWGLVRPSNTTPKLTLRFAGNDEEAVKKIQARIKEALKKHAPELKIPF